MSLRIRHVACIAPPCIGGIGSVAWEEVKGLQERGHAAELIVPDRRAVYPLGVHPWPTWARFGNAAILKDTRELVEGIDVLHLHYPFYGTAEPILFRKRSVPTVVTFHMDAQAYGWKGVVFSLHQHLLQTRLLARADRVLVSSAEYAARSSLQAWAQEHPEKIKILPFGVDTKRFHPKEEADQRIETRKYALSLLFVGGLDEAHAFKGVSILLQALARVDRVHLSVVGDGERRSFYEEQATQLGIRERVTFCGRVSDEVLPEMYRAADVCVLPSTSQAEAFGLVLLEAQASGIPVIASDLPGVRTVLQNGITGALVHPGDVNSLAETMKNMRDLPEEREKQGKAARVWVEAHFSWDVHAEELEKHYLELCASRS